MKTIIKEKSTGKVRRPLIDIKVNVKIKIAALWTAIMFLYIYNDYFALLQPGHISDIMEGNLGMLPTTQGALFAAALMMAVPAVMIFLTLVFKAKVNRITNIVVGALYAGLMIFALPGEWIFYIFMGIVEIVLTILIIWYAIKWPKNEVQ